MIIGRVTGITMDTVEPEEQRLAHDVGEVAKAGRSALRRWVATGASLIIHRREKTQELPK
jgi:hypothetical protein